MDGGKIWVSCDSQKAKSKHGSKNLEKYYRSRCPGKKILRIDAETVANPEHPAYQCAEKITELAALYDIVICSPSLATGVSVELRGHFNAVFGIFQGAISDNEVRQVWHGCGNLLIDLSGAARLQSEKLATGNQITRK
jgi:hypothetical protein